MVKAHSKAHQRALKLIKTVPRVAESTQTIGTRRRSKEVGKWPWLRRNSLHLRWKGWSWRIFSWDLGGRTQKLYSNKEYQKLQRILNIWWFGANRLPYVSDHFANLVATSPSQCHSMMVWFGMQKAVCPLWLDCDCFGPVLGLCKFAFKGNCTFFVAAWLESPVA